MSSPLNNIIGRRGRAAGWGLSLPVWVFVLAFLATLVTARSILTDQDPFLHVAAGNWIIAHRAVPYRDLFSFSTAGAPWVAHEWLSEVVLAAVYDLAGWGGLVALAALVFAATLAALLAMLLRYLPPMPALLGVIGAFGLAIGHLHVRPHIFGLPLLVVWLGALVAARQDERAPPPAYALLMLLWANLHGGFILGLGLAALFAGEALFEANDRASFLGAARGWGVFLVLAILAGLVTPNGATGLLFPVRVMQMPFAMATINEWKSPDFQYPQPLEIWLLLAILGALISGLRLPVTRVAIFLLLLHEALAHRRLGEIFGLAAPLLFAPALAPQLRGTAFAALDHRLDAGGGPSRPLGWGIAAIVVLAATAVTLRVGISNENQVFAPTAAVEFAKAHRLTGRVFNDREFGGYLIFSGIAPFIDGRADMYGDDFMQRAATPGELPGLLQQYAIAWTLIEPQDARVALLDHLAGWQRVYADDIAVIHVRTPAPAGEDTSPNPSLKGRRGPSRTAVAGARRKALLQGDAAAEGGDRAQADHDR